MLREDHVLSTSEIAPAALNSGRLLLGRPLAEHRKPRILSLGGCVTHEICNIFGALVEHKHLWRVTVPSLVTNPANGRSFYKSGSHEISERLNFELTKQALHISMKFEPDIIMLDPTSDLAVDYYEKNGCIIPDIASDLIDKERSGWPTEFPIAEWSRLNPLSARYAEIYIASLRHLLSFDFAKRSDILILQRRPCPLTMTADGFLGIQDPVISRMNSFVTDLFEAIRDEVSELKVVKLDEEMMFTSKDAPWGEWLFHPVEEFYDYAVNEIASMYGMKGRYLPELFRNRYAERVQRRRIRDRELEVTSAECQRLVEERDALAAQRDAAVAERDTLVARQDAVVAELRAIVEKRDVLVAQRDAALAERDTLVAQRDAALAERDTLVARHDAVSEEHRTLLEERDRIVSQRDALLAERTDVSASRRQRWSLMRR